MRKRDIEATIRKIDLPDNQGTLEIAKAKDGRLVIWRFAARGKINNFLDKYEYINKNDISELRPLTLEIAHKILDRAEAGEAYSGIYIFYEDQRKQLVELTRSKSEEEHKYTSTGIKFWRHQQQMESYKAGDGHSVISTHISPEGACDRSCPFCSVTYRDTHSRIELPVIKDYVEKLQTRGLKATILSTDAREQIWLKSNESDIPIRIPIGAYVDSVLGEKKQEEEFKKIKGAKVLTSDDKGNVSYQQITGVLRYKRKHPAYKITTDGGLSIIVSDNHSVCKYDEKTDSIIPSKPTELRINKDFLIRWKPKIESENEIPEVKIDGTKYKNQCCQTKSVPDFPDEFFIDQTWAYFLGIFIAEGSLSNGTITLTLHPENDDYIINFLKNFSEYLKSSYTIRPHGNAVNFSIYSMCLYKFIKSLDYLAPGNQRPSRRKKIPTIIFQSPYEVKKWFIEGVLAGDGHKEDRISKTAKITNGILKTSSRLLADDIFILSQQLGYKSRIEFGWNKKRKIEGRHLKKSNYYRVVVKLTNDLIVSWEDRLPIRLSDCPKQRKYASIYKDLDSIESNTIKNAVSNNLRFCRVRKVEKIDYASEWFYDIEVDKTLNFFSSNGILSRDTGGGEPQLYKHFDELVQWLKYDRGLDVALITNGTMFRKRERKTMEAFSWVRVSINLFDGWETAIGKDFNLDWLDPNCIVGCSMVYTTEHEATDEFMNDRVMVLNKASKIADRVGAQYVRLLPNCLLEQNHLIRQHRALEKTLLELGDSRFFQQFKVHGAPQCDKCHQSYFRPYLSEEPYHKDNEPGTVYPCDSVVLNHGYQFFAHKYQLCKPGDILDYLDGKIEQQFKAIGDCLGCVFTDNVNMLDDWVNDKINRFDEFNKPLGHENFV